MVSTSNFFVDSSPIYLFLPPQNEATNLPAKHWQNPTVVAPDNIRPIIGIFGILLQPDLVRAVRFGNVQPSLLHEATEGTFPILIFGGTTESTCGSAADNRTAVVQNPSEQEPSLSNSRPQTLRTSSLPGPSCREHFAPPAEANSQFFTRTSLRNWRRSHQTPSIASGQTRLICCRTAEFPFKTGKSLLSTRAIGIEAMVSRTTCHFTRIGFSNATVS